MPNYNSYDLSSDYAKLDESILMSDEYKRKEYTYNGTTSKTLYLSYDKIVITDSKNAFEHFMEEYGQMYLKKEANNEKRSNPVIILDYTLSNYSQINAILYQEIDQVPNRWYISIEYKKKRYNYVFRDEKEGKECLNMISYCNQKRVLDFKRFLCTQKTISDNILKVPEIYNSTKTYSINLLKSYSPGSKYYRLFESRSNIEGAFYYFSIECFNGTQDEKDELKKY